MKNDIKNNEIEKYVINIWYSKKQRVLFNFWKTFFEFSGIFVNSFTDFNKENSKPILGERKIFLLDDGQLDGSVRFEEKSLYIVSQQEKQTKFSDRGNVKVIRWGNQDDFFSVIDFLFPLEEKQLLMDLLHIFFESNMWSSIWLSNNMIPGHQRQYLPYINDNIQKYMGVFAKVQQESYYTEFSSLFMQYLTERFHSLNLNESMSVLSELVRRMNNHRQFSTKLAAWLLEAKIGSVCKLEEKYQVNCYRSICKSLDYKDAFYLYRVGHELEHTYGYIDEAKKWYQKVYQVDPTFYQVLYRRLLDREHGYNTVYEWQSIIHLLEEKMQEDLIDFQAIQYLYSSYYRYLAEINYTLDFPDLQKRIEENILGFPEYIKNSQNFDHLFECMFAQSQQEGMKKSLLNDVSLKLRNK